MCAAAGCGLCDTVRVNAKTDGTRDNTYFIVQHGAFVTTWCSQQSSAAPQSLTNAPAGSPRACVGRAVYPGRGGAASCSASRALSRHCVLQSPPAVAQQIRRLTSLLARRVDQTQRDERDEKRSQVQEDGSSKEQEWSNNNAANEVTWLGERRLISESSST